MPVCTWKKPNLSIATGYASPFLFLIKWLENTEMLKVFWQAKAKLSLLTQVAWSRVTDDTDGTDGVADILHSYSSMKTLNWKLIVPEGEEALSLFLP